MRFSWIEWSALFAVSAASFGCGGKLRGEEATSDAQLSSQEQAAYSLLHSESSVARSRSYSQIISDITNLAQRHEGLAEMVHYGDSARGQALTLLRLEDKSVHVAGRRPAALISEGIHGNEYLNITDRLPAAFLERTGNAGYHDFLAKGGVIYLVPILNPDGYDAGQRENARGTDLNRSFPIRGAHYNGIAAPETAAIRDYIAAEMQEHDLSLEVSMEYHCCIGALITPWAYTRTPPPADVRTRANEVANAMRTALGSGLRAGTVHEILNYPPTNGGSDDYYLENYGRRAYSYEGRSGTEPRYFEGHLEWWNAIFDLAATGFPQG